MVLRLSAAGLPARTERDRRKTRYLNGPFAVTELNVEVGRIRAIPSGDGLGTAEVGDKLVADKNLFRAQGDDRLPREA